MLKICQKSKSCWKINYEHTQGLSFSYKTILDIIKYNIWPGSGFCFSSCLHKIMCNSAILLLHNLVLASNLIDHDLQFLYLFWKTPILVNMFYAIDDVSLVRCTISSNILHRTLSRIQNLQNSVCLTCFGMSTYAKYYAIFIYVDYTTLWIWKEMYLMQEN